MPVSKNNIRVRVQENDGLFALQIPPISAASESPALKNKQKQLCQTLGSFMQKMQSRY